MILFGLIDWYWWFVKDYDSVLICEKYFGLVEKGVCYIFLGFLYKFILVYIFGMWMLFVVEYVVL